VHFLELLGNIALTLATIKLGIAGAHHASRRFRALARRFSDRGSINIIAYTMYHAHVLSQMRMIVNCFDNDSQLQLKFS